MEKVLSIVCFVGAVASISLLVSLIVVLVQNNDSDDSTTLAQTTVATTPEPDQLCLTSACIQEASTVLAHMNLEADP